MKYNRFSSCFIHKKVKIHPQMCYLVTSYFPQFLKKKNQEGMKACCFSTLRQVDDNTRWSKHLVLLLWWRCRRGRNVHLTPSDICCGCLKEVFLLLAVLKYLRMSSHLYIWPVFFASEKKRTPQTTTWSQKCKVCDWHGCLNSVESFRVDCSFRIGEARLWLTYLLRCYACFKVSALVQEWAAWQWAVYSTHGLLRPVLRSEFNLSKVSSP